MPYNRIRNNVTFYYTITVFWTSFISYPQKQRRQYTSHPPNPYPLKSLTEINS